jgi:hypothetical protein
VARGPRGWRRGQIINGIGATATGLVLVTVVVSKFTTGAWIPAIVVPAVVLLFRAIHRHYQHVGRQLRIPDDWQQVERVHIVMLLVGGVQRGLLEALAYTPALLPDRLVAVYVASDEAGAEKVRRRWARARTGVDVTVVIDHYRELYEPVMKVINEVDDHDELSHLTVVVPEFTTRHWWEALLHNQSAWLLEAELAQRPNTVTISVPLRPLARHGR